MKKIVLIGIIATVVTVLLLTACKDETDPPVETVHVASVSLNETSLTMTVGEEKILTPTIAPSNATNQNVEWSSNAPSVAGVANGKITAKAAGSGTITVKTQDGGKIATCSVTVTPPGPTTYAITMQNDGNGTATADPNPAAEGEEVTITATRKSGYSFESWQVVSGGITLTHSGANPTVFTMPGNAVTIKAAFAEIPPNTPSLNITPPTFDNVTLGYAEQTAKNVTVTNEGTVVANITGIALDATGDTAFTLGGTSSISTVAVDGTATFTVQPKTGLAVGTYEGNITVTYDSGKTAQAVVSFTVTSGSGNQGTAPTITTAALPNGTVGTAYNQPLAATGTAPITWTIDGGTLPTGLSLAATGAISGTPTTAGTSTFTVKATNSAGSGTKQLSITITTTSGGTTVINIPAIQGVAVPVAGGVPVTSITENAQYSGAVSWSAVPPTSRAVKIDMYDSAGDGWGSGGALRIMVNGVQKATNIKVQATAYYNNPSGQLGTNTYTFDVAAGDAVQVYWVAGSYQQENSFIVYYADTPPNPAFTSSNNNNWNGSNALVYKLRGTMNGISGGTLLGSFTASGGGFVPLTQYTATITLAAKSGYTLQGVSANFFTVAGATSVSNSANSGVVTAVFPQTGTTVIDIPDIQGITPPATGGIPVTSITNFQYSGTITWSPSHDTFAASTTYTATIPLTAKSGYTLQGVAANFFTVEEGAASVSNSANSGVVTAVFPATAAPPPIDMVSVPGGSFQMGTASGGNSDERPVHTVTLTGFYMGKYEVTQAQWKVVMGSLPPLTSAYNYVLGDNYPVYYVSWYDAIVFCNKLSMAEGLSPAYSISNSTNPDDWGTVPTSRNSAWNAAVIVSGSTGYRLPTEAQWEYAAKGGDGSPGNFTYSGSNTVGDVAWYSEGNAHLVGTKQANGLGIYDMSGNMSEWCRDWYDDYTSGAQTDPTGPGTSGSGRRVVRGGSYFNENASYTRCAYRGSDDPFIRLSDRGFRLVRPGNN